MIFIYTNRQIKYIKLYIFIILCVHNTNVEIKDKNWNKFMVILCKYRFMVDFYKL